MKIPFIAKIENIGNPKLFSGRDQELKDLLDWVELIPKEQAKSRALMATKKMGKTAILDRLFNILFQRGEEESKQPVVIPFFLRIGEKKTSQKEFAEQFYLAFLTQYLAFKCGQPEWVNEILSPPELVEAAEEFQLEAVLKDLKRFEWISEKQGENQVWDYASSAPHRIASKTGDFILQILDEFQYLNKFIYSGEPPYEQIDLAGTWHQWAESRIAPLLISGSWVGWLREILRYQLNPRFTPIELFPFSDQEALECVYNYGTLFDVTLSEESALAIQTLSRNHPYYISCLIRSTCPNKDLTTVAGVEEVLRYEVQYKRGGEIYGHWSEYINYAFQQTNGKVSKAIVLFLSGERHQEKKRSEILDYLNRKGVNLEDEELENKLKVLCRSDIIEEGSTAFRYKGIPDDLFNQVIQVLYAEEIESIKVEETYEKIREENRVRRTSVDPEIFQQNKGYFLELMMTRYLKYKAGKKDTPPLQELIQNAPEGAEFVPYQTVGEHHFNLPDGHHRQFDVFAKAADESHPSLLIECKFHEKPVGPADVEYFAQKAEEMKQQVPNLIPILYSISGFTGPMKEKMEELQLSWSTPELWDILGKQKK